MSEAASETQLVEEKKEAQMQEANTEEIPPPAEPVVTQIPQSSIDRSPLPTTVEELTALFSEERLKYSALSQQYQVTYNLSWSYSFRPKLPKGKQTGTLGTPKLKF